MKESTFNRRIADVKRAIEKVDPANRGFTGPGLAEYLNSPYDGPKPIGKTGRKLNSRGEWASGTGVSSILRAAHYPFVQKKGKRTYFHLGTDTEEMQNKHNEWVEQSKSKNKHNMDDYIEPFIRYWTDDDYGLEDIATELGVAIPTIHSKFFRLAESSAYGHYPAQYKERTGRKRKVTSRKRRTTQ